MTTTTTTYNISANNFTIEQSKIIYNILKNSS